MNSDLRWVLDANRGVLTWREARCVVSSRVIEYAAGSGRLRRLHPCVYVRQSA